MHPEQPRARRYIFIANIELIDVDSESKRKGRTRDLNLFGCQVACSTPLPAGARIRLKITYKGSSFTAIGHVARASEDTMGIAFARTTEKDKAVLESWLAELRRTRSPATVRPDQQPRE